MGILNLFVVVYFRHVQSWTMRRENMLKIQLRGMMLPICLRRRGND